MSDLLGDLQAGTEEPRDPESESAIRAEMDANVRAAIERDKLDERQQKYMRNATTGRLIRTEEQYHRMVENKHGFVKLTYNQALALYKQEEAVKKAAMREHAAKKRAKASRKRNRG